MDLRNIHKAFGINSNIASAYMLMLQYGRNSQTALGAFHRRFLIDLSENNCLNASKNFGILRPGHDEEVDEKDDGGDEGEDADGQDCAVLQDSD